MKHTDTEGRPGVVDVYPVGLLSDIRHRRARRGIRTYLIGYCLRRRRWRAARSYFNGYLAECYGHAHNAGRGWTKAAAMRRCEALCAKRNPEWDQP